LTRFRFPLIAALFLSTAPAVLAQDAGSQLQAALDAYAAGDLRTATTALTAARAALDLQKGALLASKFPPAPEGWTLTVNDTTADMVSIGGSGVDASYSHSDGRNVSITIMVDSSLVTGMAGMFASAEMLALMGEVVERPGITFAKQENGLTGLIDNRMLVSVTASGPDVAMPIVEMIDFQAIAAFDAGS
jgi:hypothetical protein